MEDKVKTRVEQLTQRNYEIPFFDNLDLSKNMSYQQDKLYGIDYKIDSFVAFNYNFSAVYDIIKDLANKVNTKTEEIKKTVKIFDKGLDI